MKSEYKFINNIEYKLLAFMYLILSDILIIKSKIMRTPMIEVIINNLDNYDELFIEQFLRLKEIVTIKYPSVDVNAQIVSISTEACINEILTGLCSHFMGNYGFNNTRNNIKNKFSNLVITESRHNVCTMDYESIINKSYHSSPSCPPVNNYMIALKFDKKSDNKDNVLNYNLYSNIDESELLNKICLCNKLIDKMELIDSNINVSVFYNCNLIRLDREDLLFDSTDTVLSNDL